LNVPRRNWKRELKAGFAMAPLIVLTVVFLICLGIGAAGVYPLDWHLSLRIALSAMFFLTASAHWGPMRKDLVAMVPPVFPQPGLLVTITGVLEILGAIGLLYSPTTQWAALGLALLLMAMFPANVYAARNKLTLRGRPATSLWPRTAMQVLFIGLLLLAGFPGLLP
jgi:uncharacterized membrane protein